jgi:hypothetical protein
MLFINKTQHPKIDVAIQFVEKLLLQDVFEDKMSSAFYNTINQKSDWSYTKDQGAKVARVLREESQQAFHHDDVEIRPYRTRLPWSSVIGYSDGENIYINMRKIDSLDVSDYVGNLVHEFCHHAGYGHGDNSPKGKQNSVPYYCGDLARHIFSNK